MPGQVLRKSWNSLSIHFYNLVSFMGESDVITPIDKDDPETDCEN